MRVLAVDDDRHFLEAVGALLSTLPGIELVGTALDGDEAVERARELEPDVVLMDIDMPRLDGVAATLMIRQELPGTRVVILSSWDVEAHVIEMETAGAVAHVRKENFVVDLPAVLEALPVD